MISTFPRKALLTSIALAISALIYSQKINLNFEDSTLSNWDQADSGRWHIDTTLPINGQGSLHHNFNNTVAGIDLIVLPHELMLLDSADAYWQFSVKYNYNPSSSNNWSCWLINNAGDEETKPGVESVGYILGVNYLGSDDYLKMWRKDKNGTDVILSSAFNWQQYITAGENVSVRVERTKTGEWTFLIDTIGSGNWNILGNVNDKSFSEINYFGLYYKYSSTQDRKLWMDDLSINGYFFTDIIPPAVDSFKIIDRNILEVYFNEPVDTSFPIAAVLNASQSPKKFLMTGNKTLYLEFSSSFKSENNLVLNNVTDSKGNLSGPLCIDFSYYYPVKYDMLITEIFADPSPSVGLPECEYLELFNRSVHPININGWKLLIGDKTIEFPEITLQSNEYYTITQSSCSENFGQGINIITFSSLPALINTGDLIQLSDKYGQLIYAVDYSDDWFESDLKKEGGWSLEMVDTDNPCLGSNNWSESKNDIGGTPGLENSVKAIIVDDDAPELVSYTLSDAKSVLLVFSENLDSLSLADMENYFISPENTHPVKTISVPPFFNTVELIFENEFSTGIEYTLSFTENGITDCSGNGIMKTSIVFGVPEPCDSSDIIINEVLFESNGYIPEFIEIYNNSGKIIDLKNFDFALIDNYTGKIKNSMILTGEQLLFFPGNYFVFTQDSETLKLAFSNLDETHVFEPESWMTLPNDGGILRLISFDDNILDEAIFNTDMHFELLTETSGISLERISNEKPGNEFGSWHSASEESGYGTPTLINSQNLNISESVNTFIIEPLELSPDNDGFNDFLTISYHFDEPGFLVTSVIFDLNGIEVKELVNNVLCSTDGSFEWDGLGESGKRLTMGYYILYIEAIHPEGKIIREKKSVLILPEKK